MDSTQNGDDEVDMEAQSREEELEAFKIRRDYRNIREDIAGKFNFQFILFFKITTIIHSKQ
jgi:hypothetical protein